MPAGRPSNYKPEYCDLVIKLMSVGKSWTAVACSLHTTREVLDTWCEKHPEFADAKKNGFLLSEAWWESIAHENLMVHKDGPNLNATLWYMNMKNRFGWRDKHEHSGDQNAPIQIQTQHPLKFNDS